MSPYKGELAVCLFQEVGTHLWGQRAHSPPPRGRLQGQSRGQARVLAAGGLTSCHLPLLREASGGPTPSTVGGVMSLRVVRRRGVEWGWIASPQMALGRPKACVFGEEWLDFFALFFY